MKNQTTLETLISYFPKYTNETLESFIHSNQLMIEIWLKKIAEAEHENTVIQAEIDRRNQAS
jgi:hypothetical protein